MFLNILKDLKNQFELRRRWLWRIKGVWARGLFCWCIGLLIVFLDSSSSFDLRFQIRPPQSLDSRFVLINLDIQKWNRTHLTPFSRMTPLIDIQNLSDLHLWDEPTWQRLLSAILKDQPATIGVGLYFPYTGLGMDRFFLNRNIVWASKLDSDGRLVFPAQASLNGANTGLADFHSDEDRTVRRFIRHGARLTHLSIQLAARYKKVPPSEIFTHAIQTINYPGRSGFFKQVDASDVLLGRLPTDYFKDKIVIVGTDDGENHHFLTPLGDFSRNELLATVTQNILDDKWILPVSPWISSVLLLFILILSISILATYPQTMAMVLLFWIAIGWSAISLWIFDTWYIWLPILAPIAQMLVTYVIFIGYQLTLKENLSWRLKQEKKYLTEVEQLKNNFVSLISHDLKTPIAKIQAICDRLLAQQLPPDVNDGIVSLRRESSELHRYIQSILRVSRVESSDFKVNKEAIDINELIYKASEQLRPLALSKGITLNLELEPIFSVEIDNILIFEVILNLIENAIKYTPDGGKIVVSSYEINDFVTVAVEDNGVGIAPADQEKIFEKFYRANEQKADIKGTGLGLFLVKYFIELHGGHVFLESKLGVGTKVGFRLPVMDVNSEITFSGVSA